MIQKLGLEFSQEEDWCGKFTASHTWASWLRREVIPGPAVEGYVEANFENCEPDGEIEEHRDAELANDIENIVEDLIEQPRKKAKKKK